MSNIFYDLEKRTVEHKPREGLYFLNDFGDVAVVTSVGVGVNGLVGWTFEEIHDMHIKQELSKIFWENEHI